MAVHARNPSYSGGRDQEYHGLKPAWANSLRYPISKKTYHKKKKTGLVEWLKVKALSSNPSATHTKKIKMNKNKNTFLGWAPVAHTCNPSFLV
jgi:hypothetical protein